MENTLKLVDCQGKTFFGDFTPIADLQLKCCIEEWKWKNSITGSNVALPPLGCLTNRQADPLRIKTKYSKK